MGKQQILLAQPARQGPWVDPRACRVRDAAARLAPLCLCARGRSSIPKPITGYSANVAASIIPAQPRRVFRQGTLRGQMYPQFSAETVRTRAKVETSSRGKRKRRHALPGRRWSGKSGQALLLGLTYTSTSTGSGIAHSRGCQQGHFNSLESAGSKNHCLVLGWLRIRWFDPIAEVRSCRSIFKVRSCLIVCDRWPRSS